MRIFRRLHYWWSLFRCGDVAARLRSTSAPGCLVNGQARSGLSVGAFGARNWLRLRGVKVQVSGVEHLEPDQTYVFISNHRSYLDTRRRYLFTRAGDSACSPRRSCSRCLSSGYGMGFVNIMAIDRSNSERARETVEAATDRIRSGRSFGVFAEGTRAQAGRYAAVQEGRVLHGGASRRADCAGRYQELRTT